MWITPRRLASCDGFTNRYSPARILRQRCVRRRKHCERIQRQRTPIIGQRSNCLVTSDSIQIRRRHMGSDYGTEATPVVESNLQGSRGKLNVILHGLFAFDQGDKIVAYIPNMGSEHVYMAGTWLAETALAEHADLTLEGVTAGKKEDNNRLNRDHNIMVGDAPVTANGHECHCVHATLRFPYPPKKFEIRSLRRFIIPAKALGGADMKRIVRGRKEVQSATVQVLTYPFENDADLRLGDHPWEPVLEWDPAFKESFVNLHVFSEPERNSTDNHLRQAFQASVGLFV